MQRRYIRKKTSAVKRFRVNNWINAPEVLVITENGERIGIMKISDALRKAQEQELDLIEVSPLAQPPVCRIMNLGKWQYQQSQKQKKQKILDTKIVRLSFKIGEHDRQIRIGQVVKFLNKGHKVKLELRLRGREKAYPTQAQEMVKKFIDDLGIEVNVEQPVSILSMTINTLVSKKG